MSRGRLQSDTVQAAKKNVAENAQKINTSKPVPCETKVKSGREN